ncbi:MAG: hypothetical protein KJP22_06070 [Acidimicrobiia bacterium]|nr:hypothetical protein [Acidimicrobiia bacterium]MBT8192947.1 hypothetical protein [Acidimicrobiia bacterium]MBT8246763.1 hypothetical protein [Acidimicrobiia bacterium]NNF87950.1 hypothetical protein [Acidimicrobiia bacterium]NNJ47798.1 hypothetical protein [Acidimicrobiia bacterium]
MSYDDRVLALFAEANPVLDHAALDDLMRPTLSLIEQGEDPMSDTKQQPIEIDRPIVRQEGNRGRLFGLAAAVAALVLGTAAWIGLNGSSEKTTEATGGEAVTIIETFFQKWNEGDINGAMRLVGDQDFIEGNLFLEPTMGYVAAVEPEGWFWSVTDCTEQVPGTYSCLVELIGDPLLDAMGVAARQTQFKVEEGKLTQVPASVGVAGLVDRRLATYAQEQDPAGYEAVCVGSNGRAREENGVVYNQACGAFLSQYVAPLAAELTAP